MITKEDLVRLKDALSKSTQGEWTIYFHEDEYGGGVIVSTKSSTTAFGYRESNASDLGETVVWHEDSPPYTRPDNSATANILGDSDLGVGTGDDQTRRNFEAIVMMQNMMPDLLRLAMIALTDHPPLPGQLAEKLQRIKDAKHD